MAIANAVPIAAYREPTTEDALVAHLRLARLPEPVRQFRFEPSRRWRFDLAWPDRHLACEVEGGTWQYGRHNRPQGFAHDCEKYNEAALAGWSVFRVTTAMVKDGTALTILERALRR